MKKVYKVTGLDCGHCAAEFEAIVKNFKGIEDAKINFILEKIIITADNKELMELALREAKAKFPEAEVSI